MGTFCSPIHPFTHSPIHPLTYSPNSEGDLLEVKLSEAGMTIKPKTAVDRELAMGRFFQMTEQIRESAKDADPLELDEAIAEAVAAAKKVTTRKIKARQAR